MRKFIPTIIYLAAVLAIIAIGMLRMPYGYYTLLRIVVFVAVLRELWLTYRAKRYASPLSWVFVGLTILYNPIFPVHLRDKEIWTMINIATWVVLAWAVIQLVKKSATVPTEINPKQIAQ